MTKKEKKGDKNDGTSFARNLRQPDTNAGGLGLGTEGCVSHPPTAAKRCTESERCCRLCHFLLSFSSLSFLLLSVETTTTTAHQKRERERERERERDGSGRSQSVSLLKKEASRNTQLEQIFS